MFAVTSGSRLSSSLVRPSTMRSVHSWSCDLMASGSPNCSLAAICSGPMAVPGQDGPTAARQLTTDLPSCLVLILTALAQPANLRTALDAGLAGFLAKDTPAVDLIRGVREIDRGGRVIDPAVAVAALDARPSPLTPRETDVLRLHSEGLDPREISDRLFLSQGTVRNYLASATDKLGARNRIHAIRVATENDWL